MNIMTKRKVEIFSAGCPACEEAVALVNSLACSSCEVCMLDMNDPAVAEQAKRLGARTVPAVAVDGELISCCAGGGPDAAVLKAAGIGEAA